MHPFERVIADTLRRFHRWRECIRKGMARVAQRGMHMDRPTGTTDDPAGLLARYPAIVVALQSGLSLRKAAAAAGVRSTRLDGVQAAITATDAQDTDLTALHFRDTAPHCKIQER